MKMFIAFRNPGLQNGNSILTVQQGTQVFFLLLLLKGSDQRMKAKLLTAFH